MRQISVALLASLLVLHPLVRVCAQVGSVTAVVRDIRSDLDLRDGHLIGPAAVKLQDVTSHACYVFLGEDHGIAEVPEFADAVLSDLVPSGTNTLALEVSPSIAKQLSLELAASNPKQTFALFLRHHPGTVPFYNTIEEFEFLRDAKARIGASFNLIGFDQEFFGASKFLLEQVGDQGLSDDLREELNALKKDAQDKDAGAEHSGKYEDLFLLSANADKLQAFADRLKSRGFNSLPVDDLLASRRIYDIFPKDNYRSNELRDLLMKRNFVRMHGTAPPCGILFKAGSNHGFRGIGPLYTRELGNFVAESADATSNGGAHILIVGGKGESLQFQAVGAPMKAIPYDGLSDSQLQPLKPFLELALTQKMWSLFDLRALRGSPAANLDLQRFIYGYDLLVVIPHPTASLEIRD